MIKDTKWAKDIIAYQDEEGKWGYFHTLFSNADSSFTTEKALRRLEILGYTIEDKCIKSAVSYMKDCLTGVKEIPDRSEKSHDWDNFKSLLLATWIRRFTRDCSVANYVAEKWAKIITMTFKNGQYDHQEYIHAYSEIMGRQPKGDRLNDFANFYVVSLVSDYLDEETEYKFLDYIINKPEGIYYSCEKCIKVFPDIFKSKYTSRYLGAIELLSDYKTAKFHLQFVVDWLNANINENGKWDMGVDSKDGIYFPLSDNWRSKEARENDCTYRIKNLLFKLSI